MSRVVLASLVVAATGCQTFVGIDDVSGHLPYVDGEYLVGLQRTRPSNGAMDVVRLRGTATLDPDTRTLALSLAQLSDEVTPRVLSENAISGLVFAEDATSVDFDLSIEIQPDATTPVTGATDSQVSARMRMKLEGDYAICAAPVDTAASQPLIGTKLVESNVVTPAKGEFDFDCDGL